MKNKTSLVVVLLLLISAYGTTQAQIINTVAGGHTGSLGDGGPATDAAIFHPIAVAFDIAGNYYITDRDDNRIRKVAMDGTITTIAGKSGFGYNGDNIPATSALLSLPYGIAIDRAGNIIFSDNGNDRIRKIDTSGTITTIAGTGMGGYNGDNIPATTAHFLGLGAVAFDTSGDLFLNDENRVRKINPQGIITTVAGTGTAGYNGDEIPATTAELNRPNYVAVDKSGNVYIADYGNNRIRKIDAFGVIHTIAGTGTQGYIGDNNAATSAELNRPLGVYADDFGNVYISDSYNNVIRKINAAGIITTIAGNGVQGFYGDGGLAITAELFGPVGITTNPLGDIYVADFGNYRIRKINSTVFVENADMENEMKMYPNPCRGNFTISALTESTIQATFTIMDITGHKIQEISAQTNKPLNINLDAPPGLYLIHVITANGTFDSKILNTN